MRFKHRTRLLATGLLLGLNAVSAQAALFDRGGGLLYDDVLKVTWLQDANYAKTSGYDDDGKMDWNTANTWAANLVYHDSVRNVDYSDWRLATITGGVDTPDCGSGVGCSFSADTSTSELAYMYHSNLGLKSMYSSSGIYQPDFGIFKNGTFNGSDDTSTGQNNLGLVTNLQAYLYWSGNEHQSNSTMAWLFGTGIGNQDYYGKDAEFYAWAVRDGDVAAVPVPGAFWLFGSSLLGLLELNRRKLPNS